MSYDPGRIPRRQSRSAGAGRQTDAHPAYAAADLMASTTSQVSRAVAPKHDDEQTITRIPKSVLRFTGPDGSYVIQDGHKQLIVHPNPPPPPRRIHWSLFIGLGMLTMLLLWVGWQWASTSWQEHNLDTQYGFPRTYQIDAVVGHEDSAAHPSHFTFENLHGHVVVTEIPGGVDLAHARIYNGGTVNSDQVPITGTFRDVNGDGRPDMIIQIGDASNGQTVTLLNNGTTFVPQS